MKMFTSTTILLFGLRVLDGSAIYGSNKEKLERVRIFEDGKLKISEDGLLMHDKEGIPLAGVMTNIWAGFSTLQALFVKEHNSLVCDALEEVLMEMVVALMEDNFKKK